MGINNFCSACSNSKNKEAFELNPFLKDLKGQYNNYKDFSYFDLHILKKNYISDDLEIEGVFLDKKGKSAFKGKISKSKIELDTISIYGDDSPEYTFEGFYNEEKKKYTGIFSQRHTTKTQGGFWIELLDNNIWTDIGVNGITSSRTPSTLFSFGH